MSSPSLRRGRVKGRAEARTRRTQSTRTSGGIGTPGEILEASSPRGSLLGLVGSSGAGYLAIVRGLRV